MDDEDPILRPFRGVTELIRLVLTSTIEPYQRFYRRSRNTLGNIWTKLKMILRFRSPLNSRKKGNNSSSNDEATPGTPEPAVA